MPLTPFPQSLPRIVLQPEQRIEPERIATWRQRLGSLSWFMRALLEPIARLANQEDGCTGRFWEGRFFSQALLDERAIPAACACVDLNPVRAGMAKTLADSAHTGVTWRLAHQCGASKEMATSGGPAATPLAPAQESRTLPAVVGHCRIADCLPIRLSQYLELVAWSGNVPIGGTNGSTGNRLAHAAGTVAAAANGPATVLRAVLDCDPSEWLAEFTAIRQRWRLVGRHAEDARLVGEAWPALDPA